jgi:hypothetical protein
MTVEASPLDRYWATVPYIFQALLIQFSRGTALFLIQFQYVLVLFRGEPAVTITVGIAVAGSTVDAEPLPPLRLTGGGDGHHCHCRCFVISVSIASVTVSTGGKTVFITMSPIGEFVTVQMQTDTKQRGGLSSMHPWQQL